MNEPDAADVVITHGGYPYKHKLDKPWVYHTHGAYWDDYEWEKWHHAANVTVVDSAIRADITTTPSEWVSRIFQRGLWIPAPVLYSGIEPTEWMPGNKASVYALWNKTRVDPVCEIDSLHELAKVATDVQFISTYGQQSSNLQVTGRLSYQSAKEHVQNASVYLSTTRETFGIGILEAMACEVPVLGWAWGGTREIVTHKETGYLVVPGDFEDLLQGLRYCLEHRERLGKQARQVAIEKYAWSNVIKAYADVYRRALDEYGEPQNNPKISVIITCYNLAHLLPRAIESVLRSSTQDFEIIIVDDNSPDDASSVAKRFASNDKRIKYVKTPSNLYLSGALNYGIEHSVGSYILPLDADNEVSASGLEQLSRVLDDEDGVDIVYGAMEVVEPDGTKFVSKWPVEFNYKAQISHRNQISSTAMYRKRVWERSGGYRRRCRTAEDADNWCRTTSLGFIAKKATNDVVLIYHNRPDSMSHVQQDWNWHDWYPWHKSKYASLTPFGVTLDNIPTYEPVKITVVIPVGPGHEEHVIDAIDSLVAQTYIRWDCIVVNDSGRPLPWIHPFVRVINTPRQGSGPACARNIGIKNSKTQFFLPLDADDFLQPEALGILIRAWESGFYVYSDWVKSETGEVITTPDYDCKDVIKRLPHPVTALYERSMWDKVGGFDEELDSWEDWDFIIALADQGFCGKRVRIPLLHYRTAAGSRRNELYERQDAAKQLISDKWHKYIVNGEQLMACGGCGSKGPVRSTPTGYVSNAIIGANTANGTSDLVLIEFLGEGGARTFRGPKTGTEYRFGADSGHKIKYVFREDIDMFVSRDNLFRVATATEQENVEGLLQAVGPP